MFYALFNSANNFQKIIEGLRMSLSEELHHISSYLHNLLYSHTAEAVVIDKLNLFISPGQNPANKRLVSLSFSCLFCHSCGQDDGF